MATYRVKGARGLSVTVPGGGGSGDVVGPAASVASEVALFDGTTGKLLKRATGSGLAKLASGVLSVVTTWTAAALTGTANRVASFDGSGNPTDIAIGSGAGTICAGNDARLSDSRAPNGAAGGDLSGTYPNPGVAKLGGVAVTVDTDGTLAANSDAKLPSQKAVKTYADTGDALKLAKASNLSDVASASTSRTNLGLGTIATQAANAVALTGGTITGITDLAIADGGTGSSTATAARTALGLDADHFGDGSDGALNFDGAATVLGMAPVSGVYTLTRDILATDVTHGAGVRIEMAGFIPYCTGTWTFADSTSILSRDALNASGITGSVGMTGTSTTIGINGTNGVNGRSTTGAGAAGTGATRSTGSDGGAGGSVASGAGGAAGVATAPTAVHGSWRVLNFALRLGRFFSGTSVLLATAGGSGGAGGCNTGAGTASSGGSGASSTPAQVFLRYIAGAGIIRTRGGNGGNAAATGAGTAGGGGGGGGSPLYVVTQTVSPPATLSALGGTGGNGAGGGPAGADGAASTVYLMRV